MADDIKINLGLDASGLTAGLQKATSEVLKLNTLKIDLNEAPAIAGLNKMETESKQTGNAIDKNIGNSVDNVKDKIGGLSDSFKGAFAGGALAGIGANLAQGLVDGFTSAVEAGTKFETALQSVAAVTGVSGAGLNDLGERAKDLAAKFGGSATTQLEAFQTVLSKFGPDLAKTPEALGTVSENVNILAKAAGLDAKQAVDALSNSMLQFGVDASDPAKLAEESGRFINVLAASAKVGAAEIPQVGEAILQAGVAASSVGVSFEETNAAIQGLAIGGKVGSEAGIALRNVMTKLISGGSEQTEILKSVGLSYDDLGTKLTTSAEQGGGLASTLELLQGGLSKIEDPAKRAAAMSKLFGAENASAAGILLKQVNNIKAFTIGVTGTTEATDQAAINMNTLSERMSVLKANLEAGLISAFQMLAPIVTGFIDNFSSFVPVLAAVGTALGAYALYMAALEVPTLVATVQTSLLNAAMLLNPAVAIAVAIAGLVVGIGAFIASTDNATEAANKEAKAQVESIKGRQKANSEMQNQTKSTKLLTDEFGELSKKTNKTAEDQNRLKEISQQLEKTYPNLVDQTKSYSENLGGVAKVGENATRELKKLQDEARNLDKEFRIASKNLIFTERDLALNELQKGFNDWFGGTAFTGETTTKALAAIEKFKSVIYTATDPSQILRAQNVLDAELKSIGVGVEEKGKSMGKAAEAAQKAIAALNFGKRELEKVVEIPPVKEPTKPTGEPKKVETELQKALEKYDKYYKDLEAKRNEYELTLKGSEEEQKKLVEQRLKDDAKLQQDYLNTVFAKTTGTDYQATLTISANVKAGEGINDAKLAYQDIFSKNKDIIEKNSTIKPKIDKDALRETEEFYKKIAESIGEQTKVNVKLIQDVASQAGATSEIELAKTTEGVQQLTGVIIGQIQALKDQLAAAQIAGADKAAELFQKQIDEQQKNLEALAKADENYKLKSQESIKKNTLEYQVQTALQTSFLNEFNSEKIRKERETNDAIRKERLGALDAEENDLNKSLAKREISAEDYAAKLADINKGREEAESKTNRSALDNLKRVGEQTAASVLKSQGDIFKKNAEKMEGNEKVFNEFVGNTLNQFSVLAASGTATLADFGAAAAGAAFDAVAAMIPSFVTGILGTSIVTMGPILGPLAAASLTGVLYGLLGLARSAAGFKDGVVGLDGSGTETSDSIPAWLSRGESVITARATKNNKEELEFMNRTGLSIGDFYRSNMPQTSVSVTPDGDLIREVRKLREETRGLGMRIQRNTSVEVSGVLTADSKSINAMIVQQKRREARR
jgi:TP901 family phage tail tape measure protein